MSLTEPVRISTANMPQPISTPLPTRRAQRWYSPYDDGDLVPLVRVFLSQPAYSRICVHSVSDTSIEVGGVLVGRWCLSRRHEQFVMVEHALPARHTRQGSAFLTFTQDSLVDIHAQIDADYKGMMIVGWYHTHPGMGIFLSHYDVWLHEHFFPEPWQVALVVEPQTSAAGFFIRQSEGLLDPTRYFGFYELDGSYGRSMVYWNNLHRQAEEKGNGQA
ncbi:MAG: Mov34/MPN/PAD-1 family protein [Anaerolineales bacterium]